MAQLTGEVNTFKSEYKEEGFILRGEGWVGGWGGGGTHPPRSVPAAHFKTLCQTKNTSTTLKLTEL